MYYEHLNLNECLKMNFDFPLLIHSHSIASFYGMSALISFFQMSQTLSLGKHLHPSFLLYFFNAPHQTISNSRHLLTSKIIQLFVISFSNSTLVKATITCPMNYRDAPPPPAPAVLSVCSPFPLRYPILSSKTMAWSATSLSKTLLSYDYLLSSFSFEHKQLP